MIGGLIETEFRRTVEEDNPYGSGRLSVGCRIDDEMAVPTTHMVLEEVYREVVLKNFHAFHFVADELNELGD